MKTLIFVLKEVLGCFPSIIFGPQAFTSTFHDPRVNSLIQHKCDMMHIFERIHVHIVMRFYHQAGNIIQRGITKFCI